jgi:hypothetical protein
LVLIGSSNWSENARDEGSGDAYTIQTRVDEGSKDFRGHKWVTPQPVPESGADLYVQQENYVTLAEAVTEERE